LYESTEQDGKMRFIASSQGYSNNGVDQMIVGIYDDIRAEFCRGERVEGPNGAIREKNWIPLPSEVPPFNTNQHFIYNWSPFQVGKIVENRLEIVGTINFIPRILEKVRGSTTFQLINQHGNHENNKYMGVVHFSVNEFPRHYFHMLIVLDGKTHLPIQYSQPFHFYPGFGVEYCLGFCINSGKYHFWVSHFDRDPRHFILTEKTIENLFIV